MFFDPALSASGQMACASCHDPAHGFRPGNDLPCSWAARTSAAGPARRAVPDLFAGGAAFTEHFHDSDDEGDDSVDNGPTGGLTWDGRMDRGREQAAFPLTRRSRWRTTDAAAAVGARAPAGYDDELVAIYGDDVLGDAARPSPR